jgi:hypothetical protein
MKTIDVEIEGITPLLMHSTQGMMNVESIKKNPAKQYDAKKDAEIASYRNKKGELIVPSRCLKASILGASSWYKVGKNSMKPIIAGCTRIEPEEIVLTDKKGKILKDYEIDLRPVVIGQARVIRARPKIVDWKLSFKIIFNETLLPNAEVIEKIIEEAGMRCGLLDFRPQKYGDCGVFKVTKFKIGGQVK